MQRWRAYARYVSRRSGAALWFVCGGLFGFSVLAGLHGMGRLAVPVLFVLALIFMLLRIPGVWMGLAGAGSVVAIGWALHITSGDTPDDQVWPVVLGVVLGTLGFVMFAGRTGIDPRSASSNRC